MVTLSVREKLDVAFIKIFHKGLDGGISLFFSPLPRD